MRGKDLAVDKPFLLTVIALIVFGFFIFSSASLGLLARNDGAKFSTIALKQLVIGVGLGSIAAFVASKVYYRTYRPYALYFLIAAVLLTLLVYIPGLGFSHGGAIRWLSLGPFSFQPAEVLKIATIIYVAAWISAVKGKINSWRYGLMPLGIAVTVIGAVLLSQPDVGSFLVILVAVGAMLLAGGIQWRYIGMLLGMAAVGCVILVLVQPYLMNRILTFVDPSRDPQGAGYQIQQSLIAIGSGEIFGRGFGQSVQKFNYLPEPVGDSIFAVLGEEFGFVGAMTLITLFILFALRGFKIAARAPDLFGGLLTVGAVILLVTQSFLNIGSVLGVFPFTGEPLSFVSQGGTAMLFAMLQVGIILNISKFQR